MLIAPILSDNMTVMQVYSDRYSTDCYSGFFTKKQLECKIGINDLICYDSLSMSVDEMDAQHDYFLMDIKGMMQETVGEGRERSSSNRKSASEAPSFDFEIQSF